LPPFGRVRMANLRARLGLATPRLPRRRASSAGVASSRWTRSEATPGMGTVSGGTVLVVEGTGSRSATADARQLARAVCEPSGPPLRGAPTL
jgi:hypothetical protein